MASRASRSGTASIELPDSLQSEQVGASVRAALVTQLAETGETLSRFDFGPPRRSSHYGMRSYDVMYRTEPAPVDGCDTSTVTLVVGHRLLSPGCARVTSRRSLRRGGIDLTPRC